MGKSRAQPRKRARPHQRLRRHLHGPDLTDPQLDPVLKPGQVGERGLYGHYARPVCLARLKPKIDVSHGRPIWPSKRSTSHVGTRFIVEHPRVSDSYRSSTRARETGRVVQPF